MRGRRRGREGAERNGDGGCSVTGTVRAEASRKSAELSKKTINALLILLSIAAVAVVFILVAWTDFYRTAGPGSGAAAIQGYIREHRVWLGLSILLAAPLAVVCSLVALGLWLGGRRRAERGIM